MSIYTSFSKTVQAMQSTKFPGTYHWNLDTDRNNNDWAIVLGWSDGFESNPDDPCTDGTYRLCAKLAYQPNNSMLQCDYDVDWLMPYDEETSEVDDTEISIYPGTDLKETVDWLLERYADYGYLFEEAV